MSIFKNRLEDYKIFKKRDIEAWKSFSDVRQKYADQERFETEYTQFKDSFMYAMNKLFEHKFQSFHFNVNHQTRLFAEKLLQDREFQGLYEAKVIGEEILAVRVKNLA